MFEQVINGEKRIYPFINKKEELCGYDCYVVKTPTGAKVYGFPAEIDKASWEAFSKVMNDTLPSFVSTTNKIGFNLAYVP